MEPPRGGGRCLVKGDPPTNTPWELVQAPPCPGLGSSGKQVRTIPLGLSRGAWFSGIYRFSCQAAGPRGAAPSSFTDTPDLDLYSRPTLGPQGPVSPSLSPQVESLASGFLEICHNNTPTPLYRPLLNICTECAQREVSRCEQGHRQRNAKQTSWVLY